MSVPQGRETPNICDLPFLNSFVSTFFLILNFIWLSFYYWNPKLTFTFFTLLICLMAFYLSTGHKILSHMFTHAHTKIKEVITLWYKSKFFSLRLPATQFSSLEASALVITFMQSLLFMDYSWILYV